MMLDRETLDSDWMIEKHSILIFVANRSVQMALSTRVSALPKILDRPVDRQGRNRLDQIIPYRVGYET